MLWEEQLQVGNAISVKTKNPNLKTSKIIKNVGNAISNLKNFGYVFKFQQITITVKIATNQAFFKIRWTKLAFLNSRMVRGLSDKSSNLDMIKVLLKSY